MTERSNKRVRKVKLVHRDCDVDDDLTEMQGKSKKLKKMVKGSAPMKLNIKVEVEEYSEDIEQNKTENIKPDHEFIAMDSTTIKDEPRVKVEHDGGVNASNGNTADSDEDDDRSQVSTSAMDEDDNDFFKPEKGLLKNIYDLSHRSARSIQQCKLSEESFFKELNELSKIHLSMADRILLVESRNTWGRTSTVTLKRPRAEVEIQNVINEWNKWILTSKFKDTPLMYKCYMCKKAWWCLYDFREHLVEKHDSEQFHCYFETMFPVCNIIAGLEAKPEFDNFSIDTDCLKCGNDYKFHQRNKGAPDKDTCFYVCQHCDAKFYTCSNFVEHQGDCVSYRKFLRNSRSDLDVLEFYRCLVCKLVLVSKEKLRKHYSGVHSVRSDMPITTQVKVCLVCNVNFSDRLFHKCLHKNYSIMCSSCKQSFPTRVTRNIHKTVHKKNFRCRICNVVLDSDCMETQHIASTHSTNFRIIYKCPTCKENIFLLNDLSSKQHTLIWHKKRFDKRRMCFEMVVVPAKCLTETVEQMDIVTSLSARAKRLTRSQESLEELSEKARTGRSSTALRASRIQSQTQARRDLMYDFKQKRRPENQKVEENGEGSAPMKLNIK
ncbi:hypothetical protein evm_013013 [Chilo suppressalis]|nr:hypothetical protein evm_013013 [Chilo suppressalis]